MDIFNSVDGQEWRDLVTGCRPIRVQRFESIVKERRSFLGSKEGRKSFRFVANFWDEKDFSAATKQRNVERERKRGHKGEVFDLVAKYRIDLADR